MIEKILLRRKLSMLVALLIFATILFIGLYPRVTGETRLIGEFGEAVRQLEREVNEYDRLKNIYDRLKEFVELNSRLPEEAVKPDREIDFVFKGDWEKMNRLISELVNSRKHRVELLVIENDLSLPFMLITTENEVTMKLKFSEMMER